MITNSEVTIYHKTLNSTTRLEEWNKKTYTHCWWFSGQGTNVNKGYEKNNSVEIRIPYDVNKVNLKDFAIGDIIVKGSVNSTAEQVLNQDHYNIVSIKDNSFGSQPHLHLGGQ